MTVENVPTSYTYLESSVFEINEYYLINIITSISMNSGTESRALKWKCNCENMGGDRSQWPWKMYPPFYGLLRYEERGSDFNGHGKCTPSFHVSTKFYL